MNFVTLTLIVIGFALAVAALLLREESKVKTSANWYEKHLVIF